MDERVGLFELVAKCRAERDARHFRPGDRIHHDQVVGKHRERADRRGEPEHVEHEERVRPELDAGADLLELGGLLDDVGGDAPARQRQSRRQPANAAADDDNRPVLPMRHARVLLQRRKLQRLSSPARRARGRVTARHGGAGAFLRRSCALPSGQLPRRGPALLDKRPRIVRYWRPAWS